MIVDQTPKETAKVKGWGKRLERLKHLHHYASLEGVRFEWFEDILLRSQLYLRHFTEMNAPLDGDVRLNMMGATETQVRAFWEDVVVDNGADPAAQRADIENLVIRRNDPTLLERAFATHRQEVHELGVACFSEPRDDIPMWSYYANGHKGVCLCFRAESLARLHSGFPPLRVEYQELYPNVSWYLASRFRRTQALVATKAAAWKHEQEWRIIGWKAQTQHPFDPTGLDGVILGCRISDEDATRVRETLSRRPYRTTLYRARAADRAFRLEIDKIEEVVPLAGIGAARPVNVR
jgi:hypothetical protein